MNKADIKTENSKRTRLKRMTVRALIAGFIFLAMMPFLLAGAAQFLIAGQEKLAADVAFPMDGEESYQKVSSAIGKTIGKAGLIDYRPNRLVERGLVEPHIVVMQQQYDEAGIEQVWSVGRQVEGISDLLSCLEEKLQSDGDLTIALVCNCYSSRGMLTRLSRTVSPAAAEQIEVVAVDPYDFTVWNWWLDSHGRRTVITSWISYLALILSEENPDQEWTRRSPKELRHAAVGDYSRE